MSPETVALVLLAVGSLCGLAVAVIAAVIVASKFIRSVDHNEDSPHDP